MNRKVALFGLVSLAMTFPAATFAIGWMGNTKVYEGSNLYPNRGAYIESSQSMTITTETWPIAANQQVVAVVTTNNWQSTQEYVFSWDGNIGNNSKWYCVLPHFNKNTSVQFYLRAQEYQNGTVYDNNGSANFGFFVRPSPNYRDTPILQWFQTDYKTIMARLPEVVAAGYGAIYLPPPSKAGGGGFSTGYNPFDLFDLGDRMQSGTLRTAYGTAQEFQELLRLSKRLGIEVYVDMVLNHSDNRASTSINRYPSLIPEDFHIKSSANTSNTEIDFNTASDFGFSMLNYDLVGLADFAHEDGNNTRTGTFTLPSYATNNAWGKPSFIRNKPARNLYPGTFTPVAEDVREYLRRWGRWMTETIGVDGYRLDAVKHIPPPFLGYAPDQPTAGNSFSRGDMLNYMVSFNPNLYIFGENFTTNAYAHREFAKTGMNLLDFNLFYNMKSLFGAGGFGDIGASLSNAYGVDGNGVPFERGGLAPSVGVSFVQSHDDGPPTSNNLAYAFLLTRTGRPKVYYDGNNILPGNWSNFPRPGRADSLGLSSDVVPQLLDARARFGRGTMVNRFVGADLYVYERQEAGKGTMLVGLNDRGDTSITQQVQTAFPNGTVLVDLSGQRSNVTVDSTGKVTITVPSNSTAGNTNNAKGYVIYVPDFPRALPSVDPVTVNETFDTRSKPLDPTIEDTYDLPFGTYGSAKQYSAATIRRSYLDINVTTDTTGADAYVKVDNGVALPGMSAETGGPYSGLVNGFTRMTSLGQGQFRLGAVDLINMPDGLHVIRVRVFKNVGTAAPVFNDFLQFVYLARGYQGTPVDGVITGSLLTGQTKNATSNSNRADGLYLNNDGQYLYVAISGRVDTNAGFTNGFMAFLDTDPGSGTGVTDLTTLKDDSGPATRLLSNRKVIAPSGFGAEMGIASLWGRGLNSAPESTAGSTLVNPFTIGSMAGAYRFTQVDRFTGVPALVAYQERTNKGDAAKGLECAVRLSDLFPSGLPATPRVGIVAGLGTTGESGSTLLSTDPTFEANGGRTPYAPWMTNQYLPSSTAISGDPGTSTATLSAYSTYNLKMSVEAPSNAYSCSVVDMGKPGAGGRMTVVVEVRALTALSGPLVLLYDPNNANAVVRNSLGKSLLTPTAFAFSVSSGSLSAGSVRYIEVEVSGPATRTARPTLKLRIGSGIY
ncbi:MAG: DUF1939 domain-containing protein [Chthonomonas sp.]|nr:DUF1939 domain-containing protein [Chthonomonas sp.]